MGHVATSDEDTGYSGLAIPIGSDDHPGYTNSGTLQPFRQLPYIPELQRWFAQPVDHVALETLDFKQQWLELVDTALEYYS
jgi:hypothetical protein